MSAKSLVPVTGEKYAILIAIEEYHDGHISEVTYAENDANGLAVALRDAGFSPSNLEIMLSASATKTRIESAIRTLCQRLRPQDKLLLFYAGHGFAENGNNFITGHDAILRKSLPSPTSATCWPGGSPVRPPLSAA